MSLAVQYDIIVLLWWLYDWRGKMGTTGGRENMSSRVHRSVKFIIFIIHLNDFSSCNALLVISQIWVISPSLRRAFVICYWKSVWYLLRCMKMVKNIYVLWDMVFIICIGIICRYFVEYGSCIYLLCETWRSKIYEKYVQIFCEGCVCKI